MKGFNEILWGFIFTVMGIAFGWALNQLGQWFRTRQEDKKYLKVVLYNLLETYFIFVRSDFDKLTQMITDKVHSKLPKEEQTEDAKVFMQALYSEIFTNHLKPDLLKELGVIQGNYQSSIKTLATIDPLQAYYLSGKSNVLDMFDSIQGLFDNIKQQFPNEQSEIEKGGIQAMKIIRPDLLHETLTDLEQDIKSIAWKIDPFTWYKTTKAIKQLKVNANERFDKEIDILFEKLNPLFSSL